MGSLGHIIDLTKPYPSINVVEINGRNVNDIGNTGPVGATGATGSPGPIGLIGATGPVGATGQSGSINNYVCQLTAHASFAIGSGVYTKITSLRSSNANGFNNTLGNMDGGTGSIYFPITGVYRINGKCFIGSGGQATLIFGRNGSAYDVVYGIVPSGSQASIEWIDTITAGTTFQLYCALASPGLVGDIGSYQGIYLTAELISQ